MSKQRLSVRVPSNIREDIERIQDEEGVDERSEAMRRVLRRGIETYDGTDTPGETLGQITTSVAGVGTAVAAIGAVLGQPWAVTAVLPFTLATFTFAILWASVRTLAGRDLV